MKTKQTEALKLALEEICIKCRSNEWGFDTPRKEILNWMHDKAAQALTQSHSDEEQPAPVAKPHEQQDYWQEEARRYAQNADFWRGKYESATAQQQDACARIIDGMADDMEREMEPSYAISWVRSKAAEIRARGEKK